MNLGMLNLEVGAYNVWLDEFIKENELPLSWFERGIDHAALKAYNPDDYDRLIHEFRATAEQISEIKIDDRRIAVVKLLGLYALDNLPRSFNSKPISNIEVMEAKIEDQSDEPVLLDHEEVFVPRGTLPISKIVERKGIRYFEQKNGSHAWISVLINEMKDELKFSDRSLEQINKADIASGRARIL